MEYKRKKRTVGTPNENNSQKETAGTHIRNICIIIGIVVLVTTLKTAILGVEYNPNGNAVQKVLVAQSLADSPLARRVEHTPDPELLEEVSILRNEIKQLKKTPTQLVSRGDINRDNETSTISNYKYDYNKMKEKTALLEIIEQECARHANGDKNKEFFEVIYSIITYESKFDPNVVVISPTEHSVGLLQVNTYTNKPKNIEVNLFRQKLKDPRYNLDYQLDELYDFFVLGKTKGLHETELAQFVAKYGQRPNWIRRDCRDYILNSINQAYKSLEKAKVYN